MYKSEKRRQRIQQRTEETEKKTHTGRQAERERKQDGDRGGGVVAGRGEGGGHRPT